MMLETPGAAFAWDAATRVVTARIQSTSATSMQQREGVARELQARVQEGPYTVLAICEGEGVDNERMLPFWAGFFRLNGGRARVVIAGFPDPQERALVAWASKYGLPIHPFRTERDAREYLALGAK
jgi:hypothetical protein